MTWEKKYRRGVYVKERDFHDELHSQLMTDPELGGRVDRGNPLALGYLDVRHDGITAELKVERKVAVTKESAPRYIGQPTQYAAADGARLSILTILDMSPRPCRSERRRTICSPSSRACTASTTPRRPASSSSSS